MQTIKEKAGKLKRDIPAVFLAMKHPKTPWYARILAGIIIWYALSPVDLIPDFVPVLGYLDDLVILPLLIILLLRLIPREVFEECRQEAEDLWANGKPQKWYYAIPIIVIWLFIVFLVLHAFLGNGGI